MQVLLLSQFYKTVQFSHSVMSLCDPMNHSIPGLPVHHQLPESIQTHVHWVGDAIQPSHPLLSPSPPALNLSQLQGLLQELIMIYFIETYTSIKWWSHLLKYSSIQDERGSGQVLHQWRHFKSSVPRMLPWWGTPPFVNNISYHCLPGTVLSTENE